MGQEKIYILEAECSGFEEHASDRWIDEEELNQIKKTTGRAISQSCSTCKLTIKDKDGNVLFIKEGC